MVNKVFLVGRIGGDPQTREVNGVNVSTFSLATSETYKDKNGQKQEQTEWHSIVCWRNLSDIVSKYCHKGDLIYIEGKLRTRSWENDKGEKRYSTDIVAQEMRMLGGKRDSAQAPQQAQAPSVMQGMRPQSQPSTPYLQGANLEKDDDDLPFD